MTLRIFIIFALGLGLFSVTNVPAAFLFAQDDPFGEESTAFDDTENMDVSVSTDDSPFGTTETESATPQKPNTPDTGNAASKSQPTVGLPKLNLSTKDVPETHADITTKQSLDLLDKAEAALAENESISPMELVRSAHVLLAHGNERLAPQHARALLRKFNEAELSDRELFDIADQMGGAALAEILTQPGLGTEAGKAVDRILAGYHNHMNRRGVAESVVLWKDLTTPKELANAASALAQVGRVEIAGVLLKRFLDAEATTSELAEIGDELGSVNILRLMSLSAIQPQGRLAVERLIKAKSEFLAEQSKRTEPVKKLSGDLKNVDSPNPEISDKAMSNIWQGKENSVTLLIQQLEKTTDVAELEKIEAILRSMKSDSRDALAVSLESDNPELVVKAAKVLYSFIPPEEVFILYVAVFNKSLNDGDRKMITDYVSKINGRCPAAEQAALQLARMSIQYMGKERLPQVDSDGHTDVCVFNTRTNRPEFVHVPALDGVKLMAERFAKQAYKISPENTDIKTVYNIAIADRLVSQAGIDAPFDPHANGLNEILEGLSIGDLESMLVNAIKRNCTGAGIAAASLLGMKGTADTVLYKQANRNYPNALIQAASCGDRRIRFAAIEAVMKLNPTRPYYGSSLVTDSLCWFASGRGKRIAVIACPKIADAMKLSGYLNVLGYETKISTVNSDTFREAMDSPDVSFVLVDSRCTRPNVSVFGQNMRADSRTREIPIAIITGDEVLLQRNPVVPPIVFTSDFQLKNSATPFANTLSMVLPYPQDDRSAGVIIDALMKTTGVVDVPDDTKLGQSVKSLEWLIAIQRDLPNVYRIENIEHLASRAANTKNLSNQGYSLLAQIRSNYSQNLLAEIASGVSVPAENREQAASAFAQSVEKFGVLVRGQQVRRLIDAQTRSYEHDSPDAVLDSLLTTIDNRMKNR